MNLAIQERAHLEALADLREAEGDAVCELLRRVARDTGMREPGRMLVCCGGPFNGQLREMHNDWRWIDIPVFKKLPRPTQIPPESPVTAERHYDIARYVRSLIGHPDGSRVEVLFFEC